MKKGNKKNICFSIIIPVYNAENTLKRTINSVLKQSYNNWELLCIDDGSLDNSLKILKRFRELDDRIQVISIENSGTSQARNQGIYKAQGEYILFLDADDCYHKDFLKELNELILLEKNDIYCWAFGVCTNEKYITTIGPKAAKKYTNRQFLEEEYGFISKPYFNSVCNKAYDRNFILKNKIVFDVDLKYGEDYCFNLMAYQTCNTIKEIDKVYYYYMIVNTDSVTNGFDSDKLLKMMKFNKKQTSILHKNKYLNKDLLEIKMKLNLIKAYYSSYMELYRKECNMSKLDKILFVKNTLKLTNIKITLKEIKYCNMKEIVLSLIFYTKSPIVILLFTKICVILKKYFKYKLRF